MNSIVERLRQHALPDPHDEREVMRAPLLKEAADLIEQQAERIKELEASLASMVQGVKISIPTQTMEQEFQSHYRRGYEAGKAALRQRIADAPVVAHITEDGKVLKNGFVRDTDKPLISKEDLQK